MKLNCYLLLLGVSQGHRHHHRHQQQFVNPYTRYVDEFGNEIDMNSQLFGQYNNFQKKHPRHHHHHMVQDDEIVDGGNHKVVYNRNSNPLNRMRGYGTQHGIGGINAGHLPGYNGHNGHISGTGDSALEGVLRYKPVDKKEIQSALEKTLDKFDAIDDKYAEWAKKYKDEKPKIEKDTNVAKSENIDEKLQERIDRFNYLRGQVATYSNDIEESIAALHSERVVSETGRWEIPKDNYQNQTPLNANLPRVNVNNQLLPNQQNQMNHNQVTSKPGPALTLHKPDTMKVPQFSEEPFQGQQEAPSSSAAQGLKPWQSKIYPAGQEVPSQQEQNKEDEAYDKVQENEYKKLMDSTQSLSNGQQEIKELQNIDNQMQSAFPENQFQAMNQRAAHY